MTARDLNDTSPIEKSVVYRRAPEPVKWIMRAAWLKSGDGWGTLTYRQCSEISGCPDEHTFSYARRLAVLLGVLECEARSVSTKNGYRVNKYRVPAKRLRVPNQAALVRYYQSLIDGHLSKAHGKAGAKRLQIETIKSQSSGTVIFVDAKRWTARKRAATAPMGPSAA